MLTLVLIAAALFLISEVITAVCSTNVTNDSELQAALDEYHAGRTR
jgi:hypothetical protein